MKSLKWSSGAAIGIAVLCCILALIWFQERVVLPDQSNYLMELLISDTGFAVFHARFISVFTQILPWLGIRAGWSLRTISQLYSLNVELFHLGCALACLGLRRPRLAIAVVLCHLLLTTDTFFWSISELTLSISLMFPLIAALQRFQQNLASVLVIAVLTTIIAFGHSLMIFPFAFAIFLLWDSRSVVRKALLFGIGAYVAAFFIKRYFYTDTYDQGAMDSLKNIRSMFPHYFGTASLQEFLQRNTRAFLAIPICLIFIFLRNGRKHWIRSLFVFAAVGGYVMLITICYPHTMVARFYLENLFQPLAFFITLSLLLYDEPASPPWLKIAHSALPLLLMGFAIYRISVRQEYFKDRLAWEDRLIEHFNGRKVIIPESAVPEWRYLLSWSSPYEFWLRATLNGKSAASIMITNNPEEARSRIGDERKAVLLPWNIYGYRHLTPAYFPFRDTLNSYRIVDGPGVE